MPKKTQTIQSDVKSGDSIFVQARASLNDKPHRIWILSMCITLLFFAIVYTFVPYVFSTNDDTYISTALGGYRTDAPVLFCQFVNPIFSYIVGGMYLLIPNVNWYTIVHIASLFVGITIIGRCFLCIAIRKQLPLLFSICTLVFIDFSLFTYVMTLLSFTTTPAVLGAAAVSLFLCSDIRNKRWLRDFIVCAVLLFICYIWRKSTGMASLCFFFGAFIYKLCIMLVKKERFAKIVKLGVSAALVVVLTAVSFITAFYVYKVQYKDFTDFDSARSGYMDYAHAKYSENQAEYDSYGINGELYNVMQSWFFMDENINTESFSALADTSLYSFTFTNSFFDAANLLGVRMFYNVLLFISNIIAVVFIIIATVNFIVNRKKLREIIGFVFVIGGVLVYAALTMYLCLTGRFPQRAMYAVYLPAFMFVVMLALMCEKPQFSFIRMLCSTPKKESGTMYLLRNAGYAVIALIFLVLTICGIYEHERIFNYRLYCMERGKQVEEYAIEHETRFFITDSDTCNDYVNANALYTGDNKPKNLIFWGGCKMYSPVFYEQLEENGYDEFYADIFFKDNVYYVGLTRYSNAAANFLRYMFTKYGVRTLRFGCSICDDVRGYIVCDPYIPKVRTGFNSYNGQKFYYSQGKLMTGWFMVDGKTYYGHLGGVSSIIVYNENSRSYTTLAGSLAHGITQIGDAAYMFNAQYEYIPGVVYYPQ